MHDTPPGDIEMLMSRAKALAGRTIAQLAEHLGREVPPNLRTHKGWLGELIEDALGATGGPRPQVDFPQLGIELKTLPVDATGKPRESTWVCAAPLGGFIGETWESSKVRAKLAHVLWIPVLSDKGIALEDRVIGTPLLWAMDPESEAVLRADWEELSELMRLGELEEIDARKGTWLQLRPKAASASADFLATTAPSPRGARARTPPPVRQRR